MWFDSKHPAEVTVARFPGRHLVAGAALTMLLAGSLAVATPALAQDETAAEATVAAEDDVDVAIGAGTPAAAVGAATGGTTTTALPSTGVGDGDGPHTGLALVGLAAAGAVAAGAVAVNRARPVAQRVRRRI